MARGSWWARSAALRGNPDDPRHGTTTGYSLGCRCERCSAARRRYLADRERRAAYDRTAWAGKRGRWTTFETAKLAAVYGRAPMDELPEMFGRPLSAIQAQARRIGAARRIGKRWKARKDRMSINRVNITGNLTRDPDLRQTSGGTSVLAFGVAVNDRRKNPQTGEWEDFPNFVDCTMFGARAEAVSRFLAKGAKVAVEGRLRYSTWEKDGQRRSKLEVVVDEIEFMSRDGQGGARPQAPAPGGYDDELPF